MSEWRGRAVVLGIVATKGSVRAFTSEKTGKTVVVNDNKRGKSWQAELAWAMRETAPPRPFKEPMGAQIDIYLPRPASHFGTGKNRYQLKPNAPKRPAVKPDWDKAGRLISDAGSQVWWWDDNSLVDARVQKFYADGVPPQVVIEAWVIAE